MIRNEDSTMSGAERVFDRVVIIMFENEYRNDVMRNPYMRSLAASGIDLGTSFGVMHPSNTNYVASIAGETCNITADPHRQQRMGNAGPSGMESAVTARASEKRIESRDGDGAVGPDRRAPLAGVSRRRAVAHTRPL